MTPMQSIEHLSPEQIAKLIDDAQKENDGLRQRATDAETRVALRDAVISILQSDVRQLELQLEAIGAGGVSGQRITDDGTLAALQSQAQIPAPTNRDEYIALLDRAIDMGKQLNVMWEEAFAEVGVKHGLQSQDREDAERLQAAARDMFVRASEIEVLYGTNKETEGLVMAAMRLAYLVGPSEQAIDHARHIEENE